METQAKEQKKEPEEKLVRPLVEEKKLVFPNYFSKIGMILVILAGLGTGFFLSQKQSSSFSTNGKPTIVKTQKVAGTDDTKTFPDKAEGTIEKGGIDGEGTHKLIRPGGAAQTVYLTSSLVNLDDFVDKKVRVWGQTFAAQKAGWLMDVGRVELSE